MMALVCTVTSDINREGGSAEAAYERSGAPADGNSSLQEGPGGVSTPLAPLGGGSAGVENNSGSLCMPGTPGCGMPSASGEASAGTLVVDGNAIEPETEVTADGSPLDEAGAANGGSRLRRLVEAGGDQTTPPPVDDAGWRERLKGYKEKIKGPLNRDGNAIEPENELMADGSPLEDNGGAATHESRLRRLWRRLFLDLEDIQHSAGPLVKDGNAIEPETELTADGSPFNEDSSGDTSGRMCGLN
ncbi:unnamed protein product [Vitrella brassicaformis CCMP3155]|uniref:Uncharacterized protein n=1 Tax=Vitrella brassicaformis (strain CCMP3155) TaxID=1169540 RepID=A0A0G4GPM4_VITBC|nr:unnamed protein product [Vitrella brassicaformis CCMP3155]|eukprot:CEM32315.1 unnamed protein product [Vitrella brassicaformis CCMP3155]